MAVGQRAALIADALGDEIRQVEPGIFSVPSACRPVPYTVDSFNGHCSCPDYQKRHLACKHMLAVEIVTGRVREKLARAKVKREANSLRGIINVNALEALAEKMAV
jgi:hypothetical protein